MEQKRILRPLGYGDLLDETFDLYKKNFLLLVGITAVLLLPVNLVMYSIGGIFAPVMAGLLGLPLSFVAMAATTWAVSRRYLGNDATILSSYRAITPKLVALLFTMIMAYLLVVAGMLLLIIPAIIFMFWVAFASEVVVLEAKSGSAAISRSRELAGGQWLRIFVVGLLTGLLVLIAQMIITAPLELIGSLGNQPASQAGGFPGFVYGFAGGIAQGIATPIQIIAFVLLYYDVRVRKEGFDLEMLAANMGEATPPASPPQEARKPL